ncbi:glutamine--fructose-6-phosphate transaminase (isomerizing) [Fibrobacterales bacterium]|nr:glutamine--fructose-6-phosphate transaminase (isomerizing) [Fibrobacterales bacterium]
MCGLVACSGVELAGELLIDSLKRLEYRGYDSAGLALQSSDKLFYKKEKGPILNLEASLNSDRSNSKFLSSRLGIAHTRWATHGVPSAENAHPHLSTDGKIAIVHNGIIENYQKLKNDLIAKGYEFQSETDSEVIVYLLEDVYAGDLKKSLLEVVKKLRGAFGIAAICSDEPGVLLGIRRGSPLILGVGSNQSFWLASDAQALIHNVSHVVYLEEGDLVEIKDGVWKVENYLSRKSAEELVAIDTLDISDEEHEGSWMEKEIREQPEALLNTIRGRLNREEGDSHLAGLNGISKELREVDRLLILACGSSYYAAKVGEYWIEELAGIPVEVQYASEFRYRNPIVDSKTLVFCISQSGETADTLAALKEAKRKGSTVLGICNAVGSSLARSSDGGIYLHCGPEIGVASTKAFLAQVITMGLVALKLGRMRHLGLQEGQKRLDDIALIPELVREGFCAEESTKKIALEISKAKSCFFLGRHILYPVAMEGALKLKEISYIHAEGYAAAELKHGPLALIEEGVWVVALMPMDELLFEKTASAVAEVVARGAKVLAVGPSKWKERCNHWDKWLDIPEQEHLSSAISYTLVLQLLSFYVAQAKGYDVDRPRNLAKSVTVE